MRANSTICAHFYMAYGEYSKGIKAFLTVTALSCMNEGDAGSSVDRYKIFLPFHEDRADGFAVTIFFQS
jgi:hypothetical protein